MIAIKIKFNPFYFAERVGKNGKVLRENSIMISGKNIENANYHPARGPFTIKHLEKAGLSKPFIQYMRKWDGFVKNEPQ